MTRKAPSPDRPARPRRARGRARPELALLAAVVVVLLSGSAGCRRRLVERAPDAGAEPGPAGRPAPASPPPCARVPGSFAELAARLAPNLVTLLGPEHSEQSPYAALPLLPGGSLLLPRPAGEDAERAPLGAGFLVDGQRLVVTSAEVAGDAPALWVRLGDGRVVAASPRGVEPELDLAVLTLDEPVRGGLALAEAPRLRPGDWVAVLGDPFGQGPGVTAGVVRSLARDDLVTAEGAAAAGFHAVDATIDAANRGGPVVDLGGRLVGMAVLAPGPGGRMGLVLPTSELRRTAATLLEAGQSARAWIGLWVRPLPPERGRELGLDPPRGLLVTRVVEGGPAAVAGIQPGDAIVEFAGEPVATPARLGALATRAPAGQQVPVTVVRAGEVHSLELRPAAMPQ